MIGILVVGYGKFASGLVSAVELIAEEAKELYYVNFNKETTIEELESKIKICIDDLFTRNSGLVIFSDFPDGVPFKTACKYTDNTNVRLISSVSVPMLIETVLARAYLSNIDDLVDIAISTGREQIGVLDNK